MNKTIDLTPIVGSQVLCEFWSSITPDFRHIAPLDKIVAGGVTRYQSGKYLSTLNCRIYHHADYWISNADRNVIIPDGLECAAMYVSFQGERYVLRGETKNGAFYVNGVAEAMNQLNWAEHIQVTGLADGYQWSA